MACAPTGSGKTISFLFPLLCYLVNLNEKERSGIKSLIIAPTRELSQQVKTLILKNNNLIVDFRFIWNVVDYQKT